MSASVPSGSVQASTTSTRQERAHAIALTNGTTTGDLLQDSIIKIEGGYARRGGVRFNCNPVDQEVLQKVSIDEYELNYDKVNVTFGTELTAIPQFIHRVFSYLRKHGIKEEGLFRKPGHHGTIIELKQRLSSGEKVDLKQVNDPHTVASLLKLYLRELADPLLTYECYPLFVAIDSIPPEQIVVKDTQTGEEVQSTAKLECLKKVLSFLPATNRELLRMLCEFLSEVTAACEFNKMTTSAMAIIFSPTILREPLESSKGKAPKDLFEEVRFAQNVIALMIDNWQYLLDDRKKKRVSNQNYANEIQGTTPREVVQSIRTLTIRLTSAGIDPTELKEVEPGEMTEAELQEIDELLHQQGEATDDDDDEEEVKEEDFEFKREEAQAI